MQAQLPVGCNQALGKDNGVTTGNTGMMLQLQRFSLDDGPGIRTTVFFKGCNLRCVWCHNPESIHPYAEVAFAPDRCTRCGACAAICKHAAQICDAEGRRLDRAACLRCMGCVESCAAGALTLLGHEMDAAQVMKDVLRDRAFYDRSGGGVTFSGGEPMLQPAFLLELLIASKAQGLNTAVDTAGNVPFEDLFTVLPYTDLFLYDIKAFDPRVHRRCTGVDNQRILENLRRLGRSNACLWVRLPYVPGLNHDDTEIASISSLLKGIRGIARVELLPYHRYGESKYENLGLPYAYEGTSPLDGGIRRVLAMYKEHGLAVECPTLRG
jgi:glycyl-radical enzyme activating protein